jgi:pyruvate/2-oxoglutarate dehydrogenase complex dihydrolipoamide dehydrogenase (E3) component
MDFDMIVIGSGQAGVPLATRLAQGGKKVLLAERGELGGTCVNTGCTPTKTIVASARAAHVARTAGRLGVRAGSIRVDFPAIIARKEGIVRSWREGVERRIAAAAPNLRLVRGHARFVGERTVEVDVETDERAGVLKVLVDPSTELVLGASIVGAEAGELIHVFAAVMAAGARARAIADMEAVHPSFAEGVQSVVMSLDRYALGRPS